MNAKLARVLVLALALSFGGQALLPPDTAGYAYAQQKKKAAAKKPAVKKAKAAPKRKGLKRARVVRAAPVNYAARFAAVVVDAETNQVLYEVNGNRIRHPASLTKMMTLYLLFEQLSQRKLGLDTLLPVSAKAAGAPPTNISLSDNDRITVRTAIDSLIIRSANDAAMVVAEALGGSQEGFAAMMNAKAKQLGMSATRFYNPSGLPDDRQVTTAFDMARLGIALKRDFPEYYHYFNRTEFEFRGREYEGHNRLLNRYQGADGIKTGYIRVSGFNLVTSASRGGHRVVGVILGGRTAAVRDQQMMDMLDEAFAALSSGRKMQAVFTPAGTGINSAPAAGGANDGEDG